jgi:hypothetical protein
MPVPLQAVALLPVLSSVILSLWPTMADPPLLAAQIEQESCISLTHSKCWNPRAELKTSREYGFGLGQITITAKFNNFEAAKGWDRSLTDWQYSGRFNAENQLRALVAYDRNLYRQVARLSDSEITRLSFMFSAYNGGYGGLLKDVALCRATKGCRTDRWAGHVERTSFRSRTAVKGYGKSFFEINREYVHNIMVVRVPKYREAMPK